MKPLALVLAVSLSPALDVGSRPRTIPTHDFATLTAPAALIGRPALYRVVLDSAEDTHDGFTLYDCKSVDGTLRAVWLYPVDEFTDEMTVEAVLVVFHHPATVGAEGTAFPAFTEFRLTKAVRRE